MQSKSMCFQLWPAAMSSFRICSPEPKCLRSLSWSASSNLNFSETVMFGDTWSTSLWTGFLPRATRTALFSGMCALGRLSVAKMKRWACPDCSNVATSSGRLLCNLHDLAAVSGFNHSRRGNSSIDLSALHKAQCFRSFGLARWLTHVLHRVVLLASCVLEN